MFADGTIFAALGATMAVCVALWPISLWLKDASIVDFWWGPGFLAQAVVVAWLAGPLDARGWLVISLVGIWALRLGIVLGRRRLAEGHEDPRYTALRQSWEPGFWWKSLLIVFVLQALIQWAVALGPLAILLSPGSAIGLLAVIGAVVALSGLALETVADRQLDRFKETAKPGSLCDTGLRAHMRHPNYTGEIVFWSGIALIGLEGGTLAALISPIVIAVFLAKVSGAPMIDERMEATRPGYAEYRSRVPGFIPRFGGLRRLLLP